VDGAPGQLEERTLHRSLKRNLVIGLAVLGVAAFAGGAYAATQSSGPSTRQAFLNDVAKRLHVTPQQLTSALSGAAVDQLQAEVKAGQLTQAQANALERKLKNGGATPLLPLTPGLAVPRAFPAFPGAPGKGFGAPGKGFGAPGKGFGVPVPFASPGFGGFGLGAAQSYLGLTGAQLIRQLQSGKSLAQIAASKGKTVAGLEQAMTAPIKKALDAAVARKAITAAEEKQILDRFSSTLSQRINQKGLPAPRALRGFFRGGQGKPYGPGNPPHGPAFIPAPGAAPAAPATPKTPAKPGVLPQLFMPAPSA
jgi:hypothetical protein